jgi:hypothetical protein
MPIIGATQLEPIAPVTNYLTGLQTARNAMLQQQEMAMAQRKFQREEETAAAAARRAAQVNALIEQKRQEGVAPSPEDFVRIGAFEEAKSLADVGTSITEGKSKSVDLVDKAMALSRQALDNVSTPEEMMAWHEANHSDPVLGPYLAQRGITAEQSRQKIMEASRDPATFQQLILDSRLGLEKSRKKHFQSQNFGGGQRVISMSEFGGPATEVAGSRIAETPLPADVAAQQERRARAGAPTTIIDPTSKKFRESLGERVAARLDNRYETAEAASRSIDTNARLRPLIDDPRFISGTFGEARTAVARAVGIDVSATEAFIAGMAEQVAARIRAFGAGTGLSNADRDYALKWAGGSPDLTTAGIARIMRINDATSDAVITAYNRERNFLAEKEPVILDYYPEIGARGVKPGDIKQGYRFKGGDPANKANWEKVDQ